MVHGPFVVFGPLWPGGSTICLWHSRSMFGPLWPGVEMTSGLRAGSRRLVVRALAVALRALVFEAAQPASVGVFVKAMVNLGCC